MQAMPRPIHATRKRSTPGASPPTKKVLVGVRVPADFHRRIQLELAGRDLSLREMVVTALTQYFDRPKKLDYAATTYVRYPNKLAREEAARRTAWIDLWVRFIGLVPSEEVEVHTRAMEWTLRTLKSSRRKPTWKPLARRKKG